MALKLYSDTDIQNIANAIRTKNGSSDTYKVSEMAQAIEDIPSGGGGITVDDLATNSAPSGAITLSPSVTAIGNYAFANKPITNIIAPNVTSFGAYSFYDSDFEHITDANFPALQNGYVLSIKSRKLKSIEITKAVKLTDGSGGFRDDVLLESVRFPNARSVGMGNSFFNGCHALEVADVGNATLGTAAFSNCYNLTKLVLRNTSLVGLGSTAILSNTPFRGYNSKTGTVYVPQALISSYQTATNWSTLYTNGTCNFVAIEGSEFEL